MNNLLRFRRMPTLNEAAGLMAFIDVLFLCLAVILIHRPEFVEPVVLPSVVMLPPKPAAVADKPKFNPLKLTLDGKLQWNQQTMSLEQWKAQAPDEIGEKDIIKLSIDMDESGQGNLQSFVALQLVCSELGLADQLRIPGKLMKPEKKEP